MLIYSIAYPVTDHGNNCKKQSITAQLCLSVNQQTHHSRSYILFVSLLTAIPCWRNCHESGKKFRKIYPDIFIIIKISTWSLANVRRVKRAKIVMRNGNGRLNKMDDKRVRGYVVQSNEAYSRGIDGGMMMERIESGIHRLYGLR